jgi:hypothetical protein
VFSGLFDLLSGTQEADTLSEAARGLVNQLQAVISNTSSFEIKVPPL